jgi:transposase
VVTQQGRHRPASGAKYRRTVERTIAWRTGYRRLATRYERCAHILRARLHLACSLIALRFLTPHAGL